jgi:hypothetical protein
MVVRGDKNQLEGECRWLAAATQVNAGTIKHVQSSLPSFPFRAFDPALITSLKNEGSRLKFDFFLAFSVPSVAANIKEAMWPPKCLGLPGLQSNSGIYR